MDSKSKLRALALVLALVAAAAGTGWALQLPLAVTMATTSPVTPRATTPTEAPDGAMSGGQARSTQEIGGLEEMSATGAASLPR